jgi:hypothetical protein
MVLIGSDFHPSCQQVCWLNQETGETGDVFLIFGGVESRNLSIDELGTQIDQS